MVKKLYFAGKFIKTDHSIQVLNPYTNSTVENVCVADESLLANAVEFAETLFKQTKKLSVYHKAKGLRHISKRIKENKQELAEIITAENGKPIKYSLAEAERASITFQTAAEVLDLYTGDYMPLDISQSSLNRAGIVKRFPIGPCLGITPFNFPLNLVAHKVAPSIAAGNPIIIKPASSTPLSALKLAEFIDETDLPKGILQVLPCNRAIADSLIENPKIKLISFTGSSTVGWKIKNRAGKKRITLELGGDAGAYIHNDADIPYAVERCAMGAFAFSGQVCISLQRLFLHKDIYDNFIKLFIKKIESLKLGVPNDLKTDIGPIINLKNKQRVLDWINDAEIKGGNILYNGGESENNILMPVVIENPPKDALVSQNEIFGPVVLIYKVASPEEMISKLNLSKYGLQAGIFTNDNKLVWRAYDEIETGGIIINDVPTFRVDVMPYGGVKDSGFGREGLRYAYEEMTEIKLLVFNHV